MLCARCARPYASSLFEPRTTAYTRITIGHLCPCHSLPKSFVSLPDTMRFGTPFITTLQLFAVSAAAVPAVNQGNSNLAARDRPTPNQIQNELRSIWEQLLHILGQSAGPHPPQQPEQGSQPPGPGGSPAGPPSQVVPLPRYPLRLRLTLSRFLLHLPLLLLLCSLLQPPRPVCPPRRLLSPASLPGLPRRYRHSLSLLILHQRPPLLHPRHIRPLLPLL